MVAKKPIQRKVKAVKKKTKVDETKKTEETENEVEKMEVEESVEVVGKDKLHQVNKQKKRVRMKGKKHRGMKFQILNMLENEVDITKTKEDKEGNTDSAVKNLSKLIKKRKNISKDLLHATYKWEIMLTGIPTKWNGNVEELTSDYKQFNLQACALKRTNYERQLCQVLHLYFKTEEDMKKAVISGPREILGITLSLRVNPIRTLYISSIPFDVNEEKAISELKEALGSGVYDITFPRNKDEKLLGHALAYVIDEAAHKKLLDNPTLKLWNGEQFCCTKEDFFKRFVLNVVFGWSGNVVILNDLVQTLEESNIHASVDFYTKKLFFLDESSVERALKKSGLLVGGRKMIFSRSHVVRFVMRGITRHAKKSEIVKLLKEIQTFNLQYNESRCKATFDVPAEEEEKCKALHLTEFAGRKIEVYVSGSEEMKLSKEMSRKKLQEYVVENDIKFKKGHRLHEVAKFYRQMKDSKRGKGNKNSKSKTGKRKNKIPRKKLGAK